MFSKSYRSLGLLVSVVILALPVASCVSNRTVASNAVDFNLAIESSQNQMLLLNVLRASNRRPMYLTGIAKVTGSNSAEFTIGLEIPFHDGDDAGKGTPSGTFGNNPTYDVPVFDTKEFMTGFLSPIKPELLAYYWDQGWPQELLVHLLVHRVRVRVTDPRNKTITDYFFLNRPVVADKLCDLEKFSRWVNVFLREGDPSFEEREEEALVGPALSGKEVQELKDLIAVSKEKLQLKPLDPPGRTQFQLIQKTSKIVLEVQTMDNIYLWTTAAKDEAADLCNNEHPNKPYPQEEMTEAANAEQRVSTEIREVEVQDEKGKKVKVKIEITLFLRSPEGVLYYLGQLARAQERQLFPRICLDGDLEPLLVLRRSGTGCSGAVVETKYDGNTYLVPRAMDENKIACGSDWQSGQGNAVLRPWKDQPLHGTDLCEQGRSMHALSLLTQLISLQKTGEGLPTTSTVRVIGQ